ncbi:MAG TPA: glycoside hydrolase family 3 N-terminal domain-containing protein [Anaerolineaceae bacterium]|nr:glycoside hydrolase family 3 N-terminal domain-containing protein [Anaerolineaceae bacterium]
MNLLNVLRLGLLAVSLLAQLAGSAPRSGASPSAELANPDAQIEAKAKGILLKLTPEERIGQLFLVSFRGAETGETTPIHDLLTRYHIGGVVLRADNDNFTGNGQTVEDAQKLINNLQQLEWDQSITAETDPETGKQTFPNYIPLFVGISQEGDGYPYDQIFSGLTPIPSEMAVGATWKPEIASQVGEVEAKELSRIGFNLFLGPSLDVFDTHATTSEADLTTRTFSGDPYWVQVMGQAYVDGLHKGSLGRMAVIAKHFPGQGSSDRLPEVEVATVRKSLDQLKQIELPPFFGVTGNAQSPSETADGLLVSHIRYLFQGNIRATTKPVSFDQAVLSDLMNLPEFQGWHENGGLLVSDDLGSRAVRRFVDPSGTSFDAKSVARDAFLAGNDLLYANNFISSNDPDVLTTIGNTLDFFTRKYKDDNAFAMRVNESVLRILSQKLKIYPDFTISSVLSDPSQLSEIGNNANDQQITFNVARNAVTLISPAAADLPKPPDVRERIMFITDTLSAKQCSQCPTEELFPADALQSAVLRLYGPQAGGQVVQSRLSSYSFTDLLNYLTTSSGKQPTQTPSALEADLNRSDWIVFSTLDLNNSRPSSIALRKLLSDRPDLIRNKKVVLFTFNAPYYLDATDISKLTVFYALYSKEPAFIEIAARVLFQELNPSGAAPVSIVGAGYDLIEATSPDPKIPIPLRLDVPEPTSSPNQTTSIPTEVPTFKVGDTLPLAAGKIYDHNGNIVPDETQVTFIFTTDGGANGLQQIEAKTVNGIARTGFRIERPGLLEIHVQSEPALTSGIIKLNVTPGASAAITVIAPTPLPTETRQPTSTSTPTPTATPTQAPVIIAHTRFSDWLLAMFLILFCTVAAYIGGTWWGSMKWGLRWGLCCGLGGLIAYSYLALELPGSGGLIKTTGTTGILSFTALGIGLGLCGGVIWKVWEDQRMVRKTRHPGPNEPA